MIVVEVSSAASTTTRHDEPGTTVVVHLGYSVHCDMFMRCWWLYEDHFLARIPSLNRRQRHSRLVLHQRVCIQLLILLVFLLHQSVLMFMLIRHEDHTLPVELLERHQLALSLVAKAVGHVENVVFATTRSEQNQTSNRLSDDSTQEIRTLQSRKTNP